MPVDSTPKRASRARASRRRCWPCFRGASGRGPAPSHKHALAHCVSSPDTPCTQRLRHALRPSIERGAPTARAPAAHVAEVGPGLVPEPAPKTSRAAAAAQRRAPRDEPQTVSTGGRGAAVGRSSSREVRRRATETSRGVDRGVVATTTGAAGAAGLVGPQGLRRHRRSCSRSCCTCRSCSRSCCTCTRCSSRSERGNRVPDRFSYGSRDRLGDRSPGRAHPGRVSGSHEGS